MKHMQFGMVIGVILFVLTGCTIRQIDSKGNVVAVKNYGPSFSSSEKALTEEELKRKIINHEVYNDHESFTVLDNKVLFFYDKKYRKRIYGTWYIRKVYNPTRDETVDSFCTVKGQIHQGVDADTPSVCYRFYPEKDEHHNLYLGVHVPCRGFGVGSCNIYNKDFEYYRFRKTEVED